MLLNQLLQILINLVPKLNRPCPALRPCQRHMLGQTLSDHPRRFKKYQGLVNIKAKLYKCTSDVIAALFSLLKY